MHGLQIVAVQPESIAAEFEIEPGDLLLAVNGQYLRDIIDYHFLTADNEFVLDVRKKDGRVWELVVKRDESEAMGLVFAPPVPRSCGNSCIFCFVHQLPKGLRSPLYVKDEDYRLSFLYGNYVTLSNISRKDLERIKEQRLSPLYVSVHATDNRLREQLLGRKGIIPIMEMIRELAKARITMHTQVVLCPGINDGAYFERTVADLASLHPWVASLAVVPVGLTRHRRGLPKLRPVSRAYAREFVATWQPRCETLAGELGEPFMFLADEFFLKAGLPFPPLETYGDLPQLENGVGMVPLFLEDAAQVLRDAEPLGPGSVTVVTGMSAQRILAPFMARLGKKTGLDIRVVGVKNRLMGSRVTVAGLVSGSDIMAALRELDPGELVLVPEVMLKEGEGVFIDDVTVDRLSEALGTKVVVVEGTPHGLYDALAQRK